MQSIVLLALGILLITAVPAFAMSTLKLAGDNRVVNVYDRNEIPKYLRSDQCRSYAYQQKFKDFVYLKNGDVHYPQAVGQNPDDLRILRKNEVCLLRLKLEDMIDETNQPVTIYELDTLGMGRNEIRVGKNQGEIDDGTYTLQGGTQLTVKDNVMISGSVQP